MPVTALRRGLPTSVIVLVVSLFAVMAAPSGARAYCNPNHQAWDPCYDDKNLKPPEDAVGDPLARSECSDLALHIAASVGSMTCRAANVSDADAHGRAETVTADGPGSFFFAQYIEAGIHTFISRQQPGDVVADTNLKPRADDWEPQFDMQGFDVRRFHASVGDGIVHCASFTKHWGHVPQTPGYRHRIIGIYCSGSAAETADDHLDRLLGSIEPSD